MKTLKPRSPAAAALALRQYASKVIPNKKRAQAKKACRKKGK